LRSRSAGRVGGADSDEKEPAGGPPERHRAGRQGRGARGNPVPRDRDVRRSPLSSAAAQAPARSNCRQDAVGTRPRQKGLARRTDRVHAGVRGLRPRGSRIQRTAARSSGHRAAELRPELDMNQEASAPTGSRRLRRSLLWLARNVAVAGLLVLLILMLFENRLIYFPTTAAEEWIEPADLPHEDVSLVLPDQTAIHAWWCPKPGADSALIHCHGNAGNLSHRAPTLIKLRDELNVSVFAFDYPGYGKSTGAPNEQSCCAAGEAAWNWLSATAKVPPERVILFGESLGGGVATDLASKHPCRALVLFRTFASIPAAAPDRLPFLPTKLLMRHQFHNLTKLRSLSAPVFIGHGDCDTLLPPHHADQLYAAAAGPKTLYWEANANHNDRMTPEFRAALHLFLREFAPWPGGRWQGKRLGP